MARRYRNVQISISGHQYRDEATVPGEDASTGRERRYRDVHITESDQYRDAATVPGIFDHQYRFGGEEGVGRREGGWRVVGGGGGREKKS
ncbi:hypothetical protein E2C01_079918 [Portunus trituberculatus]|uniref:Uncharacterized protein n=1 Tax=Portunus trituberculatus TaxID=210409 RepID=A0A5B7IU23_PORTR|nr:hypothetical protein [Portunus trituberculatus]